jgi:hypothetical protein
VLFLNRSPTDVHQVGASIEFSLAFLTISFGLIHAPLNATV